MDIPDHGYRKKVDDDTYAVFDFIVMDPDNESVQNFFGFKITYYRDVVVERGESQAASVTLNASLPKSRADSYHWEEVGSSEKINHTEGAYTINAVTDDHHLKTYRCTVKDYYNGYTHYTTDYYFTIHVKGMPDNPPAETPNTPATVTPSGAQNVVYVSGESVTLSVTATDADNDALTYTWYEKGSDVSVGSGSSLTINTGLTNPNGKVYYCEVWDGTETVKSAEFTLKMKETTDDQPPAYETPTQEKTVFFTPGDSVTLTMPSEEAEYVSFAWYAMGGDGEPVLLAEVTDTFTIRNCATEHHGTVFVCVSADEAGNKKSLGFRLVKETVASPAITSPTQHTEVPFFAGENITLSITAERADAYQWYVDKGNGKLEKIAGANESSYTITGIPGEQDGWVYLCEASNSANPSQKVLSKAFIMSRMEAPAMPKTGDDSTLFAWAGLMLCAMAACGVILCRKGAVR